MVYLSDLQEHDVCLGLIGTTTANKFCLAHDCGIQKHQASKFAYKPGLYIRVPRRTYQAYCLPVLPENSFEADLAADILTEDNTVSEWTAIFAQILATDHKMDSGQWKVKSEIRQ